MICVVIIRNQLFYQIFLVHEGQSIIYVTQETFDPTPDATLERDPLLPRLTLFTDSP